MCPQAGGGIGRFPEQNILKGGFKPGIVCNYVFIVIEDQSVAK